MSELITIVTEIDNKQAEIIADQLEQKSKEKNEDEKWLAAVDEFNKKFKEWESFRKKFYEMNKEKIDSINSDIDRRHTEATKKITKEFRSEWDRLHNKARKISKSKKLKKYKMDAKYAPMKEIIVNMNNFVENAVEEEIKQELGLKK